MSAVDSETAAETTGAVERHTITTSDGVRRKVDYSVRESTGMIGASWGVEFCVQGLDRNLAYAYATACRMARP